ncbi:unnamed protein product [Symbiodinium natans]|uniref:Methyltransferase FkbM domain-containing protein n=1 Tax=Symbiodinium natans TaxID=878477 RepID=A0A812SUX8_9DINO|nr:unnamed protein product [Symbiodinium natans]
MCQGCGFGAMHHALLLSTLAVAAAEHCEDRSDTSQLMQHASARGSFAVAQDPENVGDAFGDGTMICFADQCFRPLDRPKFDWKAKWSSFLLSKGASGGIEDPLQTCCQSCDSVAACSNSEKEEHIVVKHVLPFMLPSARSNPIFLELGGLDGWRETNTFFLEKCLGWKGMLIEASPENFKVLHRNRPNALKISSAICTNASRVFFGGGPAIGHILNRRPAGLSLAEIVTVPCSPLQAFFDVLGVDEVTVFSLDVEGFELSVLQSVDWHKLTIGALVVEELQFERHTKKNQDVRQLLKETAKLEMLGVSCWKELACDSYWMNPRLFDYEAAREYLLHNPFPSGKFPGKAQSACSNTSTSVL